MELIRRIAKVILKRNKIFLSALQSRSDSSCGYVWKAEHHPKIRKIWSVKYKKVSYWAWGRAGKAESGKTIEAYVAGVAANYSGQYFRKKKKEPTFASDENNISISDDSPDRLVDEES